MPEVTVTWRSKGEQEVIDKVEEVRRAAERAADALSYLREMLDEYEREEDIPITVELDIATDVEPGKPEPPPNRETRQDHGPTNAAR